MKLMKSDGKLSNPLWQEKEGCQALLGQRRQYSLSGVTLSLRGHPDRLNRKGIGSRWSKVILVSTINMLKLC